MGRRVVDLADQLCPVNLQGLQDTLSRCLRMPVLFVDTNGRPLAACEDLSEFCRYFTRAIPLSRPCLECGRSGKLEKPDKANCWGPRSHRFLQRCPLGATDAAVPIWSAGEIIGFLLTAQACVAWESERDAGHAGRRPEEAEEQVALLSRLARRTPQDLQAAAAGLVVVASLTGALAAARRRNLRLAELTRDQRRWIQAHERTDAVTGLANRRQIYTALEAEVARARRYKRHLSVAALDIEGFDASSHEFGHDVGDAMLRAVANCLSSTVRQTDLVARSRGDQFAIIFPETQRHEAMIALARVKAQIEDLNASGELPVEVRLAVGVCDRSLDADDLLAAASEEARQLQETGRVVA